MSLVKYTRGMAATVFVVALAACKPQAPPAAQDSRAMDIIKRAVAAPERVKSSVVEMQQFEVATIAAGQAPLSATEEKRFATYTRIPQTDGSLVLTDHVRGHFEYRADKGSWYTLQRIGGDAHLNLTFMDQEASYSFLTRFPENITRRTLSEKEKAKGSPTLRWTATYLQQDSEEAQSVRWRGREVHQGILCEVIDLVVPVRKESDPEATKQVAYYVGVADGLIRRYVETQGPEGRRRYQEYVYSIDPGFVAEDISYARFEAEVKKLIKDRPLPPVVVKMPRTS